MTMNDYHMTKQDKIDFLRANVEQVVIGDNTPIGTINAMLELYHIAQDERIPEYFRKS